jgi:hypothetical protein
MKNTFARHATRLAGVTCRALGWRPSDFWAATPTEVAAIFSRESDAAEDALSRSEFEALLERDQDGR